MDKLVPLLDKVLSALADKLGIAVDVLWNALIAQSAIIAKMHHIYALLWGIAAGLTFLFTIFCTIRAIGDYDSDGEMYTFLSAVCGIGVIVFIALTIQEHINYLTCVHNPNYWALKQILESIPK